MVPWLTSQCILEVLALLVNAFSSIKLVVLSLQNGLLGSVRQSVVESPHLQIPLSHRFPPSHVFPLHKHWQIPKLENGVNPYLAHVEPTQGSKTQSKTYVNHRFF